MVIWMNFHECVEFLAVPTRNGGREQQLIQSGNIAFPNIWHCRRAFPPINSQRMVTSCRMHFHSRIWILEGRCIAGILSFWLCTYLPPVHHPRRHLSWLWLWLWLWLWILPAPASPLYISSAKHSLAISKLYHLQVLCILVEHICVQQWHNRTLVVPFSLLMPFHLFFAHSARRVQSLFPAIMRPPLAVPDDG